MSMSTDDEVAYLNGEWVSVESSNVAAAKYEYDGQRLYLRYRDGKAYQYLGITEDQALSFARASSHGKWVWDYLRIRGTRDGTQVVFIEE